MTEHELRAALARPYDEEGPPVPQTLDPKARTQLESELERVVALAGAPGWQLLHATFIAYRGQLVSSMLGSAPDAKLPILRAKIALLDELLGWPAAFKNQAEEVLTSEPLVDEM